MSQKFLKLSRDYVDSLEDFWGGRKQTSIEHLSKALAEYPDHQDVLSLYRLWIEVLGEVEDKNGLQSLLKHLEIRSYESPKQAASFGALRGLICLELGRVEEAELYSVTAKGTSAVFYRSELLIRLRHLRGDFDYHGEHRKLEKSSDYFHLRLLASTHFYHKNQKRMDELFHRIEGYFPSAPVGAYFGFHQAYEGGDMAVALQEATTLIEKYPSNLNFRVYRIYSLVSLRRFEEATNELEEALDVHGDADADLVCMAGNLFELIADLNDDDEYLEKSFEFHQRAVALLSKLGLPAFSSQEFVSLVVEGMQEQDEETVSEAMVPRVWIYNATAKQYAGLVSSSGSEMDKLYLPVNHQAVAGDVCIFVHRLDKLTDEVGERPWKIAGVYGLSSDPLWDPMDGYSNSLELLLKPEPSIPFLIDQLGDAHEEGRSYQMDEEAIDVFVESVKEYKEQFGIESTAVEKLADLVSA